MALARNKGRQSRRIPDDIIVAMATKLEKPDPDKNSWEKYSFTLTHDLMGPDSDQRQVYMVWQKGNSVWPSTYINILHLTFHLWPWEVW